jgi:DNA-binding NarL/FixJ family response regulator
MDETLVVGTISTIVEAPKAGTREFAALVLALRPDLSQLVSPAQRTVLELLLTSLSEPEIATVLGRSKHTIHDHTKSIYQAMKVKSRVGLVLLFAQLPVTPGG